MLYTRHGAWNTCPNYWVFLDKNKTWTWLFPPIPTLFVLRLPTRVKVYVLWTSHRKIPWPPLHGTFKLSVPPSQIERTLLTKYWWYLIWLPVWPWRPRGTGTTWSRFEIIGVVNLPVAPSVCWFKWSDHKTPETSKTNDLNLKEKKTLSGRKESNENLICWIISGQAVHGTK